MESSASPSESSEATRVLLGRLRFFLVVVEVLTMREAKEEDLIRRLSRLVLRKPVSAMTAEGRKALGRAGPEEAARRARTFWRAVRRFGGAGAVGAWRGRGLADWGFRGG